MSHFEVLDPLALADTYGYDIAQKILNDTEGGRVLVFPCSKGRWSATVTFCEPEWEVAFEMPSMVEAVFEDLGMDFRHLETLLSTRFYGKFFYEPSSSVLFYRTVNAENEEYRDRRFAEDIFHDVTGYLESQLSHSSKRSRLTSPSFTDTGKTMPP